MDGQNFENENNVTVDTTATEVSSGCRNGFRSRSNSGSRTCTGDPRGRAR